MTDPLYWVLIRLVNLIEHDQALHDSICRLIDSKADAEFELAEYRRARTKEMVWKRMQNKENGS